MGFQRLSSTQELSSVQGAQACIYTNWNSPCSWWGGEETALTFPCLSRKVTHVSSAHISLCKTSQMVPPNSKGRLDTVGKSMKYLLSIMVCSHWNIISHLTSCWPLNFSRAGAVSALLCVLSTRPYGGLLVVFVVVEWVSFFFPRFVYFIYLCLVLLGLGCCTSVSLIAVCGLLVVGLIVEQGVWGCSSCGSWALEHSLSICSAGCSCPTGCGIFPDWGSNPGCLLCWQVDPLPLSHQGSPKCPSLTWFNSNHFL